MSAIPLGPFEAFAHIKVECCCVADHIGALIGPCAALGILLELDAVKTAVEALHDAAHRQTVTGVH